ncbi:MAG: 3-isopropylmalate dehydratase small subunit [Candidatus Hadarchaeota archaeon]|nr:3-isopropylmalate dehydratase small subunit [Candidatus Hadarchaeota archaeon]
MTRAWVFGHDVSTDLIIPGRYLMENEPRELAKHAMEGADPKFIEKARKGDVLIAGRNFGCGSSREHAPVALKAAGISAVIAESFARIFYRNSINRGLPALICHGVCRGFKSGDKVKLNLKERTICNLRSKRTFKVEPLPPLFLEIVNAGGLLQYLKRSR